MEVSMLCLAWLTIAQHVLKPALTARLDFDLAQNCLLRMGIKVIAVSRFRKKIVSCQLSPRIYRDFVKNIIENIFHWVGDGWVVFTPFKQPGINGLKQRITRATSLYKGHWETTIDVMTGVAFKVTLDSSIISAF